MQPDRLARIIGHVEKYGLVTLENCFYKTLQLGIASKSLIHVNLAFSGVAYEKGETAKFNTFSFSIEGLDEWIGITGIDVLYEDDLKTATIKYIPQKEIVYKLDNDIRLHIYFVYTLPCMPATKEAKVTHETFLKLSSDAEKELPEFIEYVHKITNLLCFAVDATVTIHSVSVTSKFITEELDKGKKYIIPIRLLYPSLPFTEKLSPVGFHAMLFTFAQIRADGERIINNWVRAYDKIEPSLNLYFSVKTGTHKYLEGRFLALAQALETYHRRTSDDKLMDESIFRSLVVKAICSCPKSKRAWIKGRLMHGNEINLGKRIKMIIEPFKVHIGNSKSRSKFIRSVVNTRNYLTHYSSGLKSEAVLGFDLYPLCQQMEAIFQLHLLEKLGFTRSEINSIIEKNQKLKKKF